MWCGVGSHTTSRLISCQLLAVVVPAGLLENLQEEVRRVLIRGTLERSQSDLIEDDSMDQFSLPVIEAHGEDLSILLDRSVSTEVVPGGEPLGDEPGDGQIRLVGLELQEVELPLEALRAGLQFGLEEAEDLTEDSPVVEALIR